MFLLQVSEYFFSGFHLKHKGIKSSMELKLFSAKEIIAESKNLEQFQKWPIPIDESQVKERH
jgi:hypothetical protein